MQICVEYCMILSVISIIRILGLKILHKENLYLNAFSQCMKWKYLVKHIVLLVTYTGITRV